VGFGGRPYGSILICALGSSETVLRVQSLISLSGRGVKVARKRRVVLRNGGVAAETVPDVSQRGKPELDGATGEVEVAGEWVDLDGLKVHPRNYQEHPDDQVDQLAASLEENGWYRKVLIDNTILAGHGIVLAARRVGWRRAPCRRFDLDPLEPKALKILAGDNELSRMGRKNDRMLVALLKDVRELAPGGLRGTGYIDDEVTKLLQSIAGEAAETALDRIAASSEEPVADDGHGRASTMMGMKTFIVVLTDDQEAEVREAIKQCKSDHDLETTPAAIHKICLQYLSRRP
jgi:hypothetical protein